MSSEIDNGSVPRFFVNNATWNCHYNNASIYTDFVNIRPGVCAYIPEVYDSVWLCQATDPSCWTWSHACSGQDGRAGEDQVDCSANGVSWCCLRNWETCSGRENQTNVCWATTFTNPLFAVDPASPNATVNAAEVLEDQGITPVPVPTSLFSLSKPSTVSSSVLSTLFSPASTGQPTNTTSTPPATCLTTSEVSKMVNNAHANASIAGQIIGSLVATGLIMNAILWCQRKRCKQRLKAKVQETTGKANMIIHGNSCTPSPSFGFKRSSSKLSFQDQSNSHSRSISRSSHQHHFHESEPSTANQSVSHLSNTNPENETSIASAAIERRTLLPSSPTSPHRVHKKQLSSHEISLPFHASGSSSTLRNIAEAYDEAPEDPSDLDRYVTFEAARKAAERIRLARQQQQQRLAECGF
ncbi:uncharacterized protein PV09_02702 [Verruconis gallopava]|uniref:Uncharacterized protein n=1 Tax=Verruconis gallopava TaxID=253628 RepID=A0A0D1XTX2_9PEZI|nr:uncharacterized protein PV09_02702 [Verruconis gallopava]KIW06226.1 hypothetical protein PV09_02702 [Verruconis gallopava]